MMTPPFFQPLTGSQSMVFDVSQDQWLGEKNEMRYIFAKNDGRYLVVMKSGDFKLFDPSKEIADHLKAMTPLREFNDEASLLCKKISTEYVLHDMITKQLKTMHSRMKEGQEYVMINLHQGPEMLEKAEFQLKETVKLYSAKSKKTSFFGHKKKFPEKDREGHTHSYLYAPSSVAIMTPSQWGNWVKQQTSMAKGAQLSLKAYMEATGHINAELIRVGQFVGGRLKIEAFDYRTSKASVSSGDVRFEFTKNGGDFIDAKLYVDGVEVSARQNLMGMRMRYTLVQGDYMDVTADYGDMSCVAFEMLCEAKSALTAVADE